MSVSETLITTDNALVERLFGATVQALDLFGVYLGKKLRLYEALLAGPATPPEFASRAGIHIRYATEWLEQQAVAGYLEVATPSHDGAARQYALPAGTAAALTDPTQGTHVLPFAEMIVGAAGMLPRVAEAYRTGEGISFSEYPEDCRIGQGGINRPGFSTDLVESWVPAAPGLVEKLTAGTRVADVGCGAGWAAIALATAFPASDVIGFDLDAESISDARANAAAADSPATFVHADGDSLANSGPFGLALILEALHDMSRPDLVLKAVHEALEPGGSLIIADEKVQPEFTAPGDVVERMMYGWSISWCLVNAMDDQPSRAIGTVMRESIVRDLAAESGFASVDILPIENDLFRFYHLRK